MLFLLGLILPIAYLPGAEGPVQWYLLAVALPTIIFYACINDYELPSLTIPLWLGLAFLAYATCSLFWAYSLENIGFVYVLIWGMSFILGGMDLDPRPLWRGLACGLSISTCVAVVQTFGINPVSAVLTSGYPGLLINPTVAGAACALVIVALALSRDYLFLPGPILGLALSGSRGAWLILAVALAARYVNALASLCLLLAVATFVTYSPGTTDHIRLQIWVIAYRGLTLLGWGPDAFDFVHYRDAADLLIQPQFVHNDYLQLLFEFGLGAIPLYALAAICLCQRQSPLWPLALASATLALFYFPLYHPITAFIGCFALGQITRDLSTYPFHLPARFQRWSTL